MTSRLVGHYRILEQIGAGGMGDVFRARDERLGRDVALKLIRPASSNNPDHLRRFELEARAAAALSHPNILAIYDVGFEGDTPFIVSELLEGMNLRARVGQGPIPVREAADYALQAAHGITAAHEGKIVHRDLKPENLFLTKDGRIKILDFGVAKLQAPPDDSASIESQPTVTKSGSVVGTVAYMSPEQLRGKAVDHRADIFSFGAILYELLSGRRAFQGETEVDTMTAVLREEPSEAYLDEVAIPSGYQDIIRHCLEKEPADRFQSAKDLVFALQTLTGTSTLRAVHQKAKPKRLTALPWIAAGILAASCLLLLATLWIRPAAPLATYQRLTSESGTVYSARFAANGQSIVYSAAWNGKPTQLFSTVANSLLSQPLNLTDATLLGISPTQELAIVMHGTHNGELETVNGVLARAPLAGGAPKEWLTNVRWADWDNTGNLAVVHYSEGHSRLEFPIGKVLYQSSGSISNIRFSPKGDQIAFMNHPSLWDDRGSVCVTDLSGHVKTLTPEWEAESGLAWWPDGKEIWFSAIEKGNSLNLMAVTPSGKVRSLLDLPVGITLQDISSDGRALITLNSMRLAMASSTLGNKEDVELSWHDWNVAKDISTDGQSVLFEDSSEAAGPNYAVVWRKLDGSLPVRLGEGSAGGLSPDGKWAISVSTSGASQVTLLPIGAGQPRFLDVKGLHVHNGWARFLSDGSGITVNANEAGQGARCHMLDLNGGAPRAITSEGIECGPSSPDSRYVLGVTDAVVALYPLAGGDPKPLSTLPAGFMPVQWSENGASLYGYTPGELPGRVYKVEVASGKRTLVQELRPQVPAGVVMIAPIVVGRNGKQFAYSYNQTLSTLYLVSGVH